MIFDIKALKNFCITTLSLIDKSIRYTAFILVGTSVIAIGRVIPHSSIRTEVSRTLPETGNVKMQSMSIEAVQKIVHQLYDKAMTSRKISSPKTQKMKIPLQVSMVLQSNLRRSWPPQPTMKLGLTWAPLQRNLEQDIKTIPLNSWSTISIGFNGMRLLSSSSSTLRVPIPLQFSNQKYSKPSRWGFGLIDIQGPYKRVSLQPDPVESKISISRDTESGHVRLTEIQIKEKENQELYITQRICRTL